MGWSIKYARSAENQLDKFDPEVSRSILRYMRTRVSVLQDPRMSGKALTGELAGFWRYRIGDYRAICELRDKELLVLVFQTAHRAKVTSKGTRCRAETI